MKPAFLIIVVALTSVCSSVTIAKETVLWRVTDWPPFYILEGEDKGKGLYDKMIALLAAGMPEYNHETRQMNTARWLHEIEEGTQVCHPSVLPDTLATLSVVNSILLPHRVIFKKNAVEESKLRSPISLDELLANDSYQGGVSAKRYTDRLNKIVERHLFKSHIYESPNYKKIIALVLHGRIDYIIEYAPIIYYSAKNSGIESSTTSLEIFETRDTPYLLVHVGCPKTEWGEMMIKKINKILISESQKPNHINYLMNWYDENSQSLLKKYYKEHYFTDK